MAKDQIQVAIVGGGIAGLALAAGLVKKQHIDVHVYESVPIYKDVGAGLALHLNAIKAMTLIGPEIRQAYFEKALTMGDEDQEMVTEVILGQGPHKGKLVAELGRAKGRKTVSRADLLDGFLELIPKDKISFGKKLVDIKEQVSGKPNVHLTFQDGTEVEADCLLGADGIHSVTRSFLLGADHPAAPPQNHDGWRIYRTMVPTAEARKQINPKWTTHVPILLGPRGHINCIPLNKNTRLSAGVAVRGAVFSPTGAAGAAAAQDGSAPPLDPALYEDYSEDAQRIVRMVAADTSASWTAADHDHAPYYARGRVAMFGDAAHASMPFAGNGAAQALEDAAVLDRLFSRVRGAGNGAQQIEHALLAFDRVRRPRSQAVVDLARKFGRVYAYAEDGMHEDPERMKRFFGEMAAFTNEFDVKGQNEAALKVFEELELEREMEMEMGDGDG
ncbi:FAD/NAD(P)-binding domain-containing protein [Daldinia bambusicola]|nr:FAD/NAD(P)-binding domain-containing protein [Daldinia bambusicola]